MKRKVPLIKNLADEAAALYDVLNNESDAVCVLLSASYLDFAVASLLKHFFIESKTANEILEPPKGVLSTFASRYQLAYCLGLIRKGLYQNLEQIGTIRNEFAHDYFKLLLSDPRIVEHVNKLTLPTIAYTLTIAESVTDNEQGPWTHPTTPRDKFNIVVALMVNRILITGLETKHRERLKADW